VIYSHGHSRRQKKPEICRENRTDLEGEDNNKGAEKERSCKIMSMVPGGYCCFEYFWCWSWIGPRLLQLHVCATLMVGRWWRVVRRTHCLVAEDELSARPRMSRARMVHNQISVFLEKAIKQVSLASVSNSNVHHVWCPNWRSGKPSPCPL